MNLFIEFNAFDDIDVIDMCVWIGWDGGASIYTPRGTPRGTPDVDPA